jgi:acetaldehyde dehydrogenase (acetylating)
VKDWREGCERCKQILRYGGMGHTMSIHSQNDQIILEFGLKKPAFRIVVNSPTTHGSVGLSTGLDPAMTLGCGGYGGNITSDNISPRHLLNIKRLAYEVTPTVSRWERPGNVRAAAADRAEAIADPRRSYDLPAAPARPPASASIEAAALTRRIDQFLSSRGFQPPSEAGPLSGSVSTDIRIHTDFSRAGAGFSPDPERQPLDFVCEDDVRRAIQAGRKLSISERAIVTPAARDLGEQHRIFNVTPWRG